jgi:hypothetical protein
MLVGELPEVNIVEQPYGCPEIGVISVSEFFCKIPHRPFDSISVLNMKFLGIVLF